MAGTRAARALAAWAVMVALLGPLVTGSGSAAAATTLTLSPATDLVDGQVVSGEVGGLTGGAGYVLVGQCPSGIADWDGCWFLFDAEIQPDGTASGAGDVHTVLSTTAGEVDCRAAGACEAVAWVLDDDGETTTMVARTPLHFDPDGALLPGPTLRADPSSGLVDGQVVAVGGSGFPPGGPVFVRQCVPRSAGYGCRYLSPLLTVDGTGSFTVDIGVRALIRAYAPDGTRSTVDCRVVADPCVISAYHPRGDATTPLAFDPAGPLRPPPVLTVEPSEGIAEGATVQLRGSGFDPGMQVGVLLCRTGTDLCDRDRSEYLDADDAGRVSGAMELFGTFDGYSFETTGTVAVDCRAAPFCELQAEWGDDEVPVSVPVRFGPAPPALGRYFDPVFHDVDVTRDLVYRSTLDYQGNAVDLHLDIYQPRGDRARRRPAVVWMHGGYFIFGDRDQLADEAVDSARRGYVGVTLQYRLRPGISFTDWDAMALAAHDAHDDAVAALAWLRQHAREYRIDPRALVVAGYSAGGVMAWNLAYPPAGWADPGPLAASIPMAGLPFAPPRHHAPPVLAFHATDDEVLPVGPARDTCAAAVFAETVCEWVEYPDGGHLFGLSRTRSIRLRAYEFLGTYVLGPLGYLRGGGKAPLPAAGDPASSPTTSTPPDRPPSVPKR